MLFDYIDHKGRPRFPRGEGPKLRDHAEKEKALPEACGPGNILSEAQDSESEEAWDPEFEAQWIAQMDSEYEDYLRRNPDLYGVRDNAL